MTGIINKVLKLINREFNSIRNYKIYLKNIKKINVKHKKSDKIKIAFIIQYPETWNSLKPVYEYCLKKNINTIVLCIPKPLHNDTEYEVGKNEAWESLKNEKDVINAYLDNNEWYDLKSYKPDYIFYTRPYNMLYPNEYKANKVSCYSKVCYIPYGYNIGKIKIGSLIWLISYNSDFMLSTYLTFFSDRCTARKIKKKFLIPSLLNTNKYLYLGYPRFDLLTNLILDDTINNPVTITWIPRWNFKKKYLNDDVSNFLNYYKKIINFAKKNTKYNFIIRPHPLMFQELLNLKILNKEEIKKIKEEMTSVKNISIDLEKDYIKTIETTDILIADMSTLIVEFYITGKPIIYCSNPNNLEKNIKKISKTFYKAKKWEEIEKYIEMITNDKDYLKETRKKTIKELLKEENGNSSKKIIEYVITDYYKG